MKNHRQYGVIGACLCAALLAGCSAGKGVFPALPISHAAPRSQAKHHAIPFISREFVYVANGGSDNISVYRVRSGGALKEVASSPFAAGTGPGSVGIDLSGKSAYVSNQNYPSPTGTISA